MFDYEKQYTFTNELGHTIVKYYPVRYTNTTSKSKPVINGTWVDYGTGITSTANSTRCPVESTNGELLISGSLMSLQQSCEPHTYNAGNYYNYPSAAPNSNQLVSICSKGWRLPENDSDTSYSNLLLAYGIDFNAGDNMVSPYDAALLNLPLSFLRSGAYLNTGSLSSRGSRGDYRMSWYRMNFTSILLFPNYDASAYTGYSVRCVSR